MASSSSPHKWVTPGFVVQVLPRPADAAVDSPCRVGFTATRKLGNAVVRNRAKRRLRALVQRGFLNVLPALPTAQSVVFIARPAVLTLPMATLERDFSWAVRRLGATWPAS